MKEIKATLYRTDGSRELLTLTFATRLETLQKLVGGYIEVITINSILDTLKGIYYRANDLIINDEGKLLDLPVNPWSQFVTRNTILENEIFRGDIVLIEGRLP
jgi:hypothetical protein